MKDDSQASTSIWMATADTPSQSRLKENIRTDVCIIGAGIAGMTTAYLLGREGRSVVVLDDGLIGGGMTGRTTAHLSNAYDDRYVGCIVAWNSTEQTWDCPCHGSRFNAEGRVYQGPANTDLSPAEE